VLIVLALAAGAAASWHFASEVVVPERAELPANVAVERVAAGRVVLSRSDDTQRQGVYGLDWQMGHAIVGGVLAKTDRTVTRQLRAVRGYLVAGMKVAIDQDVYVGNPREALGLPFTVVRVPGELGAMPAWLIPARSHTWAIVVHGINGNLEGDLRMVGALHRAHLPALLITYREDLGAPRSPDGHHHMGETEWRDLQAAARFALSHGARRLVLVGTSMGGAIVAQLMERSPLAGHVAALVLDAPALSWKAILSFNASRMGLPSFAALPVEWAIDVRIDPNWGGLDALDHPSAFHLPMLLFHGTADTLVPISTSEAFARQHARWITYYRVPGAAHAQSWNADPALYERRVDAFLAGIGV